MHATAGIQTTLSIVGIGRRGSLAIRKAKSPSCAAAATAMPGRCVGSAIGCSTSFVRCSNGKLCSIPNTQPLRWPQHDRLIPLFDRTRPFLRPDLPPGRAPRAEAVQDGVDVAIEPHQRDRGIGATHTPMDDFAFAHIWRSACAARSQQRSSGIRSGPSAPCLSLVEAYPLVLSPAGRLRFGGIFHSSSARRWRSRSQY